MSRLGRLAAAAIALFLALFGGDPPALAFPPQISVRLFEAHPGIDSVQLVAPFRIVSAPAESEFPRGSYAVSAGSAGLRLISAGKCILQSRELVVAPLNGRTVTVVAAGKRRHYGGSLLFSSRVQSHGHPELLAINTVSSREYVESVVGGETQPDWPVEAVKAQAVLAETVLARLTPGATIGDSTQRQLYLGSDYIRPGVPERVAQVWQEILTWKGVPAIVFYHSTCAGMTSNGGDIFGSSASGLTYLKARKCDYCRASPFWKETVTRIKADRFQSVFGAQVPTFDAKDEAGRPMAISYNVGGKRRQMSGYEFWTLMGQRFGWDKAPGLRFTLSRVGDFIEVRSTGAGHGVGLCDWGAAEQARQGRTYKQILEYYFPGCSVTRQGG